MRKIGRVNPAGEAPRCTRERRLIFRWMRMLSAAGDVRKAKIKRVRRGIGAGDYENQLKFEIAVERLVGEFCG